MIFKGVLIKKQQINIRQKKNYSKYGLKLHMT